jgi:hypothetical protein
MDHDEAEQAPAARLPWGNQRDAIALILGGIALLWIPLLLQFAGDVIPLTEWVRMLVALVPSLLMVAAMVWAGLGRPRTTFTWARTLALGLTVVFGVIPLLAMVRRLAGAPDTMGPMNVPMEWMPVFWVLIYGALANVEPSIRVWHHVFFWSMVVLAWTFWVVPEPWRYFAANAGCCLVMIAVGCSALLQQSRHRVGVAA